MPATSPAPLARPVGRRTRTKDHVLRRGRLIGQIKKNQNSRAVAVSLPGCGIKQAAKHLFTMSKDPAAEPRRFKAAKLAL